MRANGVCDVAAWATLAGIPTRSMLSVGVGVAALTEAAVIASASETAMTATMILRIRCS